MGKQPVKYVKYISDKTPQVRNKHYLYAHRKANEAEKKSSPKMYSQENKAERTLKKGELMAKETRSGKVEVEKRFKKFSKTLSLHERTEVNKEKKLSKKK